MENDGEFLTFHEQVEQTAVVGLCTGHWYALNDGTYLIADLSNIYIVL